MASSQVQQLKQSLSAFGQKTEGTSQALISQGREFERYAQHVLSLMEGSATGKDREVVQSIRAASRAAQEAGRALAHASRAAKDYGSSI